MNLTKTDWFLGTVMPARDGLYELRGVDGNGGLWARFERGIWYVWSRHESDARAARGESLNQGASRCVPLYRWRGLANDPNPAPVPSPAPQPAPRRMVPALLSGVDMPEPKCWTYEGNLREKDGGVEIFHVLISLVPRTGYVGLYTEEQLTTIASKAALLRLQEQRATYQAEIDDLKEQLKAWHVKAWKESGSPDEVFRDAERFREIEKNFSMFGADIDGNHTWVYRWRGPLRGPNLRAAIDNEIAKRKEG